MFEKKTFGKSLATIFENEKKFSKWTNTPIKFDLQDLIYYW